MGSKARQVEMGEESCISTPSPREALVSNPNRILSGGPPPAHPQGHTPASTSLSLGHYIRGPLPLANLSVQPGLTLVTLWALDYLPAAWPGTFCREAQDPILAPGDN